MRCTSTNSYYFPIFNGWMSLACIMNVPLQCFQQTKEMKPTTCNTWFSLLMTLMVESNQWLRYGGQPRNGHIIQLGSCSRLV